MSWMDHLPVLVVILPLLSAPLCALQRKGISAWAMAASAAWLSFGAAAMLLWQVWNSGTIRYAIGGWEPPWGIEYRIDLLGGFLLIVVTMIAALVLSFARLSVKDEIPPGRTPSFYAAFLLTMAGLSGITVTGDAFNLFVFLEISSLSAYALISMGSDRRALNAAFRYLVMGSIGATFILIGIGFLYMMTGTLNMEDLATRLPAVSNTRTVRAGFAFLTIGFGLKFALFPLHLWLPNAYAFAPSVVSAFLASTATKVAVYALMRFLLGIFGLGFALGEMPLNLILITLGSTAILSASLVAIYQNNVRRMLAYSSVAQIGYIALGIGLASSAGIAAAILHLFNHALIKGALFLALGAVTYRLKFINIKEFAGMGRRMPWTMAAICIGGLSLVGIPLTVGFISKWYLVVAILEQDLWPLAVLVLAGSFLALIYVGRLIEIAYFQQDPDPTQERTEAPISMLLPIWVLVAANLYFGIHTEFTVGIAEKATAAFLGTTP
jgi:multicomponent Na+:H+ antiporter subunit D